MTAVTMRFVSLPDAGQTERVEIALMDGPDDEQSRQWIRARGEVETPMLRPVLTLQILALTRLHDLVFEEKRRLERLRFEQPGYRGQDD